MNLNAVFTKTLEIFLKKVEIFFFSQDFQLEPNCGALLPSSDTFESSHFE